MTIKEIKEEFARKSKAYREREWDDMADWMDDISASIKKLLKDGHVSDFSNDFLRYANGFQNAQGFYGEFSIYQTLDLHSISATKRAAKAFAEYIIND